MKQTIIVLNKDIDYSEALIESVVFDLCFSERIGKIIYWNWVGIKGHIPYILN